MEKPLSSPGPTTKHKQGCTSGLGSLQIARHPAGVVAFDDYLWAGGRFEIKLAGMAREHESSTNNVLMCCPSPLRHYLPVPAPLAFPDSQTNCTCQNHHTLCCIAPRRSPTRLAYTLPSPLTSAAAPARAPTPYAPTGTPPRSLHQSTRPPVHPSNPPTVGPQIGRGTSAGT